jgi:phosphoribosylamine--glycine ligase
MSGALNVLVVGGGGREHALAWKIAQSPRVAKVYVAPGNAGTARDPHLVNVPIDTIPTLVAFARRESIGLTIVGPEAPLAAGVVDAFRVAGLPIYGPTRAAARVESSKDFAKAFMARHGIPTAAYRTFADATQAHAYVAAHGAPIVVKADGLAAGKGVVVAQDEAEAHGAIDAMLSGNALGAAGARIVVEDFLDGEEASFIVMADGAHALALASSQDHKRLVDGDVGPNTGGMGAYSPAPVVTPEVEQRILREVIEPTLHGMASEGAPFIGFLYAGLMIDKAGNPKVIEFNVRFGDPETQPIMLRLKSDLVELIEAALDGRLAQTRAQWDARPSLGVVVAAGGYPGKVKSGDVIDGLDADFGADAKVFHAGTKLDAEGRAVTAGGRVLTVCALGKDIAAAREHAYDAVAKIRFDGAFCRRDIAHRALHR